MLKLFKEYKEKKAFEAFITDKVERLLDSYKVNRLESEGKLIIIRHDLYSNYIHDYNEEYEVGVTTIDNHLATSNDYIFKCSTPYSNDNDLQQIEDTINDLWDKRAEEKQAKVENKIKENAKYYQQNLLDNEVVKMGMDKHLVDITFSETRVYNDWNINVAEFTINVANLKYLDKNNDIIIKHYNLMIYLSKDGDSYLTASITDTIELIASYIDGLDKYVTEQERLKKLIN